jgi:hypothetical protein
MIAARLIPYRVGEPMRCPTCRRNAWNVGRTSAECAGCGYLAPLESLSIVPAFKGPRLPVEVARVMSELGLDELTARRHVEGRRVARELSAKSRRHSPRFDDSAPPAGCLDSPAGGRFSQ